MGDIEYPRLVRSRFIGFGPLLEYRCDLRTCVDALWRELEPLRTSIENMLQSDLLAPDVADRTHTQLHRLEAELGETGGALGGVVRSYYLALVDVLATAHDLPRVPAENETDRPASHFFGDLRAGIDAMSEDPQQPKALGLVLDAIEAAAVQANPEVSPGAVREVLEVKLGLRDRISDGIDAANRNLIESRGLIGLGTTLGAGTGVGLVSVGASEVAAAGGGVVVTIAVSILAMANRAYRISRKRQ